MHVRQRSTARGWGERFRDAFRGVKEGVRGQATFFAHFFATAVVIAAAVALQIDRPEQWCALVLCITIVLTAEMFNSALESLAKAVTDQVDPYVRTALDIGSAAVLVAAVGASVVGAIIFLTHIGPRVGWW